MLMPRIKEALVFLGLVELRNVQKFEFLFRAKVQNVGGVESGPPANALLVFFSGLN